MKVYKLSHRILLKNICVQFNDRYTLDHLCNHLITKHFHATSMPVFYHSICAVLGMNNDMTCQQKKRILDIVKRKTKQGATELSHCTRQSIHTELQWFGPNEGHSFNRYIIKTSLCMYQHFIRRQQESKSEIRFFFSLSMINFSKILWEFYYIYLVYQMTEY